MRVSNNPRRRYQVRDVRFDPDCPTITFVAVADMQTGDVLRVIATDPGTGAVCRSMMTEAAAIGASKLIGRGDEKAADAAAVEAMRAALVSGDICKVADVMELSGATLRIIKQNHCGLPS